MQLRQALFLGSGVGYDCGLPLLSELSAELRRWLTPERLDAYNAVWQEEGRGWPEELIGRLSKLLLNPELSYEDIAAQLQRDYAEIKDPQVCAAYGSAYNFLLQTLYGLLLERQLNNAHYSKVVMADYRGLKALAEANHPLWIFTSNQDCLVELLAAQLFIPVKFGFTGRREISVAGRQIRARELEFETLALADLEAGSGGYFAEGEYGINLVKLQGSLDMFNSDGRLYKLCSDSRTFDNYMASLRHLNDVNREMALLEGGVTNNETLFLNEAGELQSWRKALLAVPPAEKSLGSKTVDFYPEFASGLSRIEELVVIGYGYGNSAVNDRLKEWLGGDSKRRVDIVDPAIGKCPPVLAEQSAQVQIVPGAVGASEYFLALSGAKVGLIRRMQRNARAKARQRLFQQTTQGHLY